MAVGFSRVLVLLAVFLLVPIFTAPLAFAFHRALGAARDPAHRTTPAHPWTFFKPVLIRKLRWWVVAWIALFIVAGVLWWNTMPHFQDAYPWLAIWGMVVGLSVPLGILLFALAFCIFLAPRISGTWILSGAIAFPSVVLFVVLFIALSATLPMSLGAVGFSGPRYNIVTNIVPIHEAFLSLLAVIGASLLAKRAGRRWYRFEE